MNQVLDKRQFEQEWMQRASTGLAPRSAQRRRYVRTAGTVRQIHISGAPSSGLTLLGLILHSFFEALIGFDEVVGANIPPAPTSYSQGDAIVVQRRR